MKLAANIEAGVCIGVARRPQKAPEWEWVEDTDSRVVAYFANKPAERLAARREAARRRINNMDPLTKLMLEDLATLRGLTMAQLRDDYRGRL